MRYFMIGDAVPQAGAHALTAKVALYTDAGLFFAFAMVTASAWEVWRRTRPLVVEHRAAKAAIPPSV